MPFKNKISANIGLVDTATTITDTVTAGYMHTIIGLSLANTGNNNITVSTKLVKSGGTSVYLIKDATVLPGGALVVVGGDQKVVLETGDSLIAWSSTSNTCDVALSYLSGNN